MTRLVALIVVALCFVYLLPPLAAQDHLTYFASKPVADSLVSAGNYPAALPYLRKCRSDSTLWTMIDEFRLGYALFKEGTIDSAAVHLKRSLVKGFYFNDMSQVEYWSERGVFDRFRQHEQLRDCPEMLITNTKKYINKPPIDTALQRELIARREKDQSFRKGPSQGDWRLQVELDKQNQEFLRGVLKRYGWPGYSLVGYEGSNAAFLIAQHADLDTAFQKLCLRYIRDAYYRLDVNTADYAYIIDRTRVNAQKPQVFGSQYQVVKKDGKNTLELKPVDDIEFIDQRRKVMGLNPVNSYLDESRSRLGLK